MPSIVLVRHGQASFGADNYDKLSDLGRRQAAAAGLQLLRSGVKPDRVYSGTLERQKDTAELALGSMGHSASVTNLPAFDEYDSSNIFAAFLPSVLAEHPDIRDRITPEDYGLLHDRSVFQRLFFPVMRRWIEGSEVNGETYEPWSEFQRRVVAGLDQVSAALNDDECAVVFTSGGVISASMTHALGMESTRSPEFNWRTANASITSFVRTARGIELEGYNNYSHLQTGEEGLRVTYL